MPSFEEKLETGKVGESEIAKWFNCRGHHVLPIYEIEDNQYKGPAVYSADSGNIIAPDMIVFGTEGIWWVEAKHKSAFSWHRIKKRWVTGIDLHHYAEYQKIDLLCDWPVWLLFLHRNGTAKDTPSGMISPTGLFGNSLEYLIEHENHRHTNHGKTGMVYWAVDSLKKMDSYPLGETQAIVLK